MKNIYRFLNVKFGEQYVVLWSNLSRLAGILIIVNISMFFLTEAVTKQGYYYPLIALVCLSVAMIGQQLPVGLLDRLWYYCIFLVLELAALYFLGASVNYWVVTGRVQG